MAERDPGEAADVDAEVAAAIARARGAWAIVRMGRPGAAPRTSRFPGTPLHAEARALAAWALLGVRSGWALLVDPAGTVVRGAVGDVARDSYRLPAALRGAR